MIDFNRTKDGVIPPRSRSIEYDPNRTCNIALLHYHDGEKRYILAPRDLQVGDVLQSGQRLGDSSPGNSSAAALHPGRYRDPQRRAEGRRRCQDGPLRRCLRSSMVAKEGDYRHPAAAQHRDAPRADRLPGHRRRSRQFSQHELVKIGKAGRNRWKGKRPQTRGVAMNPVDHPHGGGEGKTSGGRHPVSPWGKPEGRTRKSNQESDKLIVRRRRTRGSRR